MNFSPTRQLKYRRTHLISQPCVIVHLYFTILMIQLHGILKLKSFQNFK